MKHLLRHDCGNTFEVIIRVLRDDLEYHVSWQVLDAKRWVPQHRERVFIVGFRNKEDFDFADLNLP